jgi:phage baseplate assembly protein W
MALKKTNKLYSDIDLSFSSHPVTGDVAMKYDVQAVKQSLKTLILTQYYERPFQPNLGSPIYKLLFENLDIITANALKMQLELLIAKHEPRISTHTVNVLPLFDSNSFRVEIYFHVIGIAEPATYSTILKRRR